MSNRKSTHSLPPAAIRYGGKDWVLTLDDDACEEMDAFAYVDVQDQSITYSSGALLPTLQEFILHELVHVIEYAHGLTHGEQVTQTIANGVLTMLRDNPRLTMWLLKKAR